MQPGRNKTIKGFFDDLRKIDDPKLYTVLAELLDTNKADLKNLWGTTVMRKVNKKGDDGKVIKKGDVFMKKDELRPYKSTAGLHTFVECWFLGGGLWRTFMQEWKRYQGKDRAYMVNDIMRKHLEAAIADRDAAPPLRCVPAPAVVETTEKPVDDMLPCPIAQPEEVAHVSLEGTGYSSYFGTKGDAVATVAKGVDGLIVSIGTKAVDFMVESFLESWSGASLLTIQHHIKKPNMSLAKAIAALEGPNAKLDKEIAMLELQRV